MASDKASEVPGRVKSWADGDDSDRESVDTAIYDPRENDNKNDENEGVTTAQTSQLTSVPYVEDSELFSDTQSEATVGADQAEYYDWNNEERHWTSRKYRTRARIRMANITQHRGPVTSLSNALSQLPQFPRERSPQLARLKSPNSTSKLLSEKSNASSVKSD